MKEAVLAVNPDIEIAPYQQIEEQITGMIQRGDLQPGAALPTVRQLADDLNVAPNTVARAYADLAAGGWIVSEGRRGTRIASRLPTTDKRVRTQLLRDAVDDVIGSLLARGYAHAEILTEVRRVLHE